MIPATEQMAKKKKKKRSQTKKPEPVAKRSELHRSLYDAGLRYFENEPWQFLEGEDIFAVRVPDESHPLALSVLGAAGEEYGLSVLRGPSATGQMELLATEGRLEPSEINMMSLSIDKYKRVPEELRAFYKRAGVKPSPAQQVPVFFVKEPYRVVREPKPEEVETLLYVINGVLTATERGVLREGETTTPDGLLTLNLSGDRHQPEVEVDGGLTVPRLERPPKPTLLADRQGLTRLPILSQTWIVACRFMPIRIAGMPDEIRALLVMDEQTGEILSAEIVHGVEASIQSARHLVDIMLGQKRGPAFQTRQRAGRPRGIIFVDAELYDILGDQLNKAGIACNLVSQTPRAMQEALDGLMEHLGEGNGF